MDNNNKYPHEIVREKLEKMQTFGGAAIRPFALYEFFYDVLQGSPSSMNKVKARDITDTYCALCNEFFVINHFSKKPRTDFFMSNERWEKYLLGQKARENSIKFLSQIELIHCKIVQNPCKPINKVRMYTIDLKCLTDILDYAEDKYEKRKKQEKNTRLG